MQCVACVSQLKAVGVGLTGFHWSSFSLTLDSHSRCDPWSKCKSSWPSWFVMDDSEFLVLEENCSSGVKEMK